MTCFGDYREGDDVHVKVGECSVCEADINSEGQAVDRCEYSSELCKECGHAPCDESC